MTPAGTPGLQIPTGGRAVGLGGQRGSDPVQGLPRRPDRERRVRRRQPEDAIRRLHRGALRRPDHLDHPLLERERDLAQRHSRRDPGADRLARSGAGRRRGLRPAGGRGARRARRSRRDLHTLRELRERERAALPQVGRVRGPLPAVGEGPPARRSGGVPGHPARTGRAGAAQGDGGQGFQRKGRTDPGADPIGAGPTRAAGLGGGRGDAGTRDRSRGRKRPPRDPLDGQPADGQPVRLLRHVSRRAPRRDGQLRGPPDDPHHRQRSRGHPGADLRAARQAERPAAGTSCSIGWTGCSRTWMRSWRTRTCSRFQRPWKKPSLSCGVRWTRSPADSAMQERLLRTITEFDRTLQSLRGLLETLGEKPNALIFSSEPGEDPQPPAGPQ